MSRKPLSKEKKVLQQEKPLGVTLAELKAEISAADGDLRREIPMSRKSGSLRLVVRCKSDIPVAWCMSLILDRAMIDCVHFHRTSYTNTEGIKTVGWHRDLMESGQNVGRKTLKDFNPKSFDDFAVQVLGMFKVTLKPGREDANGQMPID